MTELGIGTIGWGWMGQVHTRAYRRLRDHFPEAAARPRLVIAADASPERRRDAADRGGYAETTDDWRAVIDHPEVDVVSITAPNALHRDIAVAAAEAGRHVWLEKPCGRSPAETAEIADAVRRAGVVSSAGFNYRCAPAAERARELIAAGEIGEPVAYRGCFLADYASDPRGGLSWRFRRDAGGLGVLGDLMTHSVDMALWLLGPVAELSAEQATFVAQRPVVAADASHFDASDSAELGEVENEDYAAAVVRFAGGARGTLEAGRVVVGPRVRMSFEVHGREGALAWDVERMGELRRYERRQPDPGYRTALAGPGTGEFGRFQPTAGLAMSFDDLKVIEAARFLDGVIAGEPRGAGLEEARAAMEVVAAMQRAATHRGWVAVGRPTGAATAAAGTERGGEGER